MPTVLDFEERRGDLQAQRLGLRAFVRLVGEGRLEVDSRVGKGNLRVVSFTARTKRGVRIRLEIRLVSERDEGGGKEQFKIRAGLFVGQAAGQVREPGKRFCIHYLQTMTNQRFDGDGAEEDLIELGVRADFA